MIVNYVFDFDNTLTVTNLSTISEPIFATGYLKFVKDKIFEYDNGEKGINHEYSLPNYILGGPDEDENEHDLSYRTYIFKCEKGYTTEIYSDMKALILEHGIKPTTSEEHIDVDTKTATDINRYIRDTIFGGYNRYAKLVEMFNTLRNNKIKIHILSSNFSYIIWFVLVAMGLHVYFDYIVCLPRSMAKNFNNFIISKHGEGSNVSYEHRKIADNMTKETYISRLARAECNHKSVVYIDDDPKYNVNLLPLMYGKISTDLFVNINYYYGFILSPHNGLTIELINKIIKHIASQSKCKLTIDDNYNIIYAIEHSGGKYKSTKNNYLQLKKNIF
jgi:FMN phosphatase YigB (HAD superfamily)